MLSDWEPNLPPCLSALMSFFWPFIEDAECFDGDPGNGDDGHRNANFSGERNHVGGNQEAVCVIDGPGMLRLDDELLHRG